MRRVMMAILHQSSWQGNTTGRCGPLEKLEASISKKARLGPAHGRCLADGDLVQMNSSKRMMTTALQGTWTLEQRCCGILHRSGPPWASQRPSVKRPCPSEWTDIATIASSKPAILTRAHPILSRSSEPS